MPYITLARREDFKPLQDKISEQRLDTTLELNYALTLLAISYLKQHGYNYHRFNEVIGAMECAKLEVARRLLYPHEDKRKDENGDVF